MKKLLLFALLAMASEAFAQSVLNTPIGQWTSFYSYNEVTDFVEDGTSFYVGTQSGFYTYNRNTGEIEAYNKTTGMSGPGVAHLAHDVLTDITVIGYQNSNIDLFLGNRFFNIPSLFLSQASGNKSIFDIICHQGIGYLSTGKGLILLNLERREIKETVVFYDQNTEQLINSTAILNNEIYVTTNSGIYKTALNNPSFIYYGTWDKISTQKYSQILSLNNKLYLLDETRIDVLENNTITNFYTHNQNIASIYAYSETQLGFSTYIDVPTSPNAAFILNEDASIAESFPNRQIVKLIKLGNNQVFAGEYRIGLIKIENGSSIPYVPNAMIDYRAADVAPYDGNFGIAHGGHGDNYHLLRNANLYSVFRDGNFRKLTWVSDDYTFSDFIRIVRDPRTGSYFSSAFGGGVSELTKDFTPYEYKTMLEPRKGEVPAKVYVYGLGFDSKNNLWVVNSGTDRLLKVKTPEGNWYASKSIANPLTMNLNLELQSMAGDIIIDGYDNKWIIPIIAAGGIIAYTDNGTIDNPDDDFYRVLQVGRGNGNLPSNKVLCAAVDKNDNIWIGTDIGIAIFSCTYDIKDNCDADIPIVENKEDNILGRLFENITVSAIAVDGANRKWIGTTAGLWLVSNDGSETLLQFNTNNSPLPSNNIKRINIDPINGDVYISTDLGLVRYRSTATEGRESIEKPLAIYPNPVPSGFGGQIAINGLTADADVRIVDMNGNLVFRTRSLGGQAVWDGMDYLGKRAQSGIYIVMVRSKDGTEKASGKIIFRE